MSFSPQQERHLAARLRDRAAERRRQSDRATWFGPALWCRFQALWLEEIAQRLHSRSNRSG